MGTGTERALRGKVSTQECRPLIFHDDFPVEKRVPARCIRRENLKGVCIFVAKELLLNRVSFLRFLFDIIFSRNTMKLNTLTN